MAPYLRSGSREVRFAACWVLGEIGTSRSLTPLAEAARAYLPDEAFAHRTRVASDQITARG